VTTRWPGRVRAEVEAVSEPWTGRVSSFGHWQGHGRQQRGSRKGEHCVSQGFPFFNSFKSLCRPMILVFDLIISVLEESEQSSH
jgi:hypothetical protein